MGVGDEGEHEDPVALVGGADVGRVEAAPLRIEPERGQVAENGSQAPSKQPCDVLQQDVAGSKLANAAGDLWPEPPRVGLGLAGAGVGDGLAGEPGGHNGNWRDARIVDLLEVAEVGDAGPALGEHRGAVGVGLGLPGDPGAVALKRQVQAADADAQRPGVPAGQDTPAGGGKGRRGHRAVTSARSRMRCRWAQPRSRRQPARWKQ